jgi:hypothetical protein
VRRIVTAALLLAWTAAPVALCGCSKEPGPANPEAGKQMQEHWKAKMSGKKPDAEGKK